MKLVITCDCGERDTFDQRDYGFDDAHLKRAIEEWRREHIRQHEKVGDYDEYRFATEVSL